MTIYYYDYYDYQGGLLGFRERSEQNVTIIIQSYNHAAESSSSELSQSSGNDNTATTTTTIIIIQVETEQSESR